MQEIEKMIEILVQSFSKAAEDGKSFREAALIAELAVRREYAGERVYIARLPKAQHRHDLQALGTGKISPVAAAAAIGVSRRTIFNLKKGK